MQGIDKAAHRKADRAMTRLLAQVDGQRAATSVVTLGYAIDEWLRTSEHEESTRKTYLGYIDRSIKPVLGGLAVSKIDARALESFYTELRRCRTRCDRNPFIEKHATRAEHDCGTAGCRVHVCKPMAASTVRQMHAIISGTLTAAVRWDWITANPARIARRPKQKTPEPDPPTSTEAARLVDAAFEMDEDWGILVWVAMTTGPRRGELCGLRFSHIDFDAEIIDYRRNWVAGREKDTKTHQRRRIALDSETVVLLKEHRDRVKARIEELGGEFTEDLFVFTGVRSPDHHVPYSPNAVSQRYKDMATRLGIDTHLHALRHYSATELLTAGVDLRTVAGRLGHGGGGSTTLRVYAAWVAAADRKAAELLGSRMPKRVRKSAGDSKAS
ncbi:tyrosine-type recombinase/integrase [Actinoalloteichus hymeniacidonis]|uniref:tyrosine-type recombinase/integrase n=1 Tax=Actinoalloteichus hymeniacidonis TaxID=340345 RepID=UPI0018513C82|nr:site-specific integrase [Actinoalloteichus hymeniacidonis]MBB5909117.1 integrase [Actinoalloteichus hymeniacidonis]